MEGGEEDNGAVMAIFGGELRRRVIKDLEGPSTAAPVEVTVVAAELPEPEGEDNPYTVRACVAVFPEDATADEEVDFLVEAPWL